MSGLVQVVGPTIEPITLLEAKNFARITIDAEDALVSVLISSARRAAEEWLNQSLVSQQWDYFLDAFPTCRPIRLPRPPVLSVDSVKYTPNGGSPVTVSASDYVADTTFDRRGQPREVEILPAVGKSWPSTVLQILNGVVVRYTAGYGVLANNVPANIRLGISELVAYWYFNRDSTGTIPDAIGSVLSGVTSGFAFA